MPGRCIPSVETSESLQLPNLESIHVMVASPLHKYCTYTFFYDNFLGAAESSDLRTVLYAR